MIERLSFVRMVCSHPDDDTVRLVFADWLEEHGEPERAEFIRVQVELSGWGDCLHGAGERVVDCRVCVLKLRERELFHAVEFPVLESDGGGPIHGLRLTRAALDKCGLPVKGLVSRGFVSHLACTAGDWLRVADALAWHPWEVGMPGLPRPCPETAQPIERVTLTTVPDVRAFSVTGPDGFYWDEMADGSFRFQRWPWIAFELPDLPAQPASPSR